MRYWLMKTEPGVFSFEDLLKSPKQTTSWEGVRNYQARNLMRDDFKVGDKILVYHSGIDQPCIAGLAEVVRGGYPDHLALDPRSKYFDPDAAKKKVTPWVMVDVRATHRFKKPVTRDQLKAEKKLQEMMVLRKGARLSVQPVTEPEFVVISQLGAPEKI